MADENDNLERNEEPSPKRREEARKKGQVAKSRLLLPAASLLFFVSSLHFASGQLVGRFERLIVGFFSVAGTRTDLTRESLFDLTVQAGSVLWVFLVPFFIGACIAVSGTGLLQTGLLWNTELLQPDFSRINPISGFSRLFGFETAIELLKTLLCVGVLGSASGLLLFSQTDALSMLTSLDIRETLTYGGRESLRLLKHTVGILTAFAILDYFFQRWQTEKKLRMSRQELKEEMREQDGDPQIKSRLKSIRHKLARQRMMADVAKADVVVTNPEELAVAIRYRQEEMTAPRVVAKGAGHIARQIRTIARSHGIPIAENKPLARLLYRTVDVGKEIPETLYRVVAEVLAYVYRLRQGRKDEGV
jgi:flagellar biosynthetic protein FlhB